MLLIRFRCLEIPFLFLIYLCSSNIKFKFKIFWAWKIVQFHIETASYNCASAVLYKVSGIWFENSYNIKPFLKRLHSEGSRLKELIFQLTQLNEILQREKYIGWNYTQKFIIDLLSLDRTKQIYQVFLHELLLYVLFHSMFMHGICSDSSIPYLLSLRVTYWIE